VLKLYHHKPLNYGFVILCADNNMGLAKSTVLTIRRNYSGAESVVAVSEKMHKDDVASLRGLCPTFQGKDTITSLINCGMKHAPADWNFIVFAGSYVRPNLDKKFSLFVERNTDILFPIADGKYTFVDGTMNGIFMHRDTFKLVGDMADKNPLEICKLFWSMAATEKGCKFKAIAGTKIC